MGKRFAGAMTALMLATPAVALGGDSVQDPNAEACDLFDAQYEDIVRGKSLRELSEDAGVDDLNENDQAYLDSPEQQELLDSNVEDLAERLLWWSDTGLVQNVFTSEFTWHGDEFATILTRGYIGDYSFSVERFEDGTVTNVGLTRTSDQDPYGYDFVLTGENDTYLGKNSAFNTRDADSEPGFFLSYSVGYDPSCTDSLEAHNNQIYEAFSGALDDMYDANRDEIGRVLGEQLVSEERQTRIQGYMDEIMQEVFWLDELDRIGFFERVDLEDGLTQYSYIEQEGSLNPQIRFVARPDAKGRLDGQSEIVSIELMDSSGRIALFGRNQMTNQLEARGISVEGRVVSPAMIAYEAYQEDPYSVERADQHTLLIADDIMANFSAR